MTILTFLKLISFLFHILKGWFRLLASVFDRVVAILTFLKLIPVGMITVTSVSFWQSSGHTDFFKSYIFFVSYSKGVIPVTSVSSWHSSGQTYIFKTYILFVPYSKEVIPVTSVSSWYSSTRTYVFKTYTRCGDPGY